MESMFSECIDLKRVPYLETSNIKDVSLMFFACETLEKIPNLNLEKVVIANNFLNQCKNLKEVPFLNTSNIEEMTCMFGNCDNLKQITEPFDTSNVKNIYGLFYGCKNLKKAPQLNLKNATNINGMFSDCENLETIIILLKNQM